ncbi:hypothetical protein J8273_6460 [Carpediemonas membranifera]|uniref:Uncharacterized protein n=1 Tax=Carpediemonas membranifera TaxID=201153 RepID=A0A8J6B0K3_9EUKA|nr:hypothetical protein J8273_6460 [Carpediemonas membranifera]|eukprot:KAG9391684.1 hypothetical protein J8273_6460 [Carpediemonas membranifera]
MNVELADGEDLPKFYSAVNIATRDGIIANNDVHHHLYTGRLFEMMPGETGHTRVNAPTVSWAFGLGSFLVILAPPRGIYVLDRTQWQDIQFDQTPPEYFMCARDGYFTQCPRWEQFEESVPLWHKDDLLRDAVSLGCVLVTPVGHVAAGRVRQFIVGPDCVDSAMFCATASES